MLELPELSVVLPAFQEEENLRLLLPRLNKVLAETQLSYEVLVIDTSSPLDNTKGVCDSLNANYFNRMGGDSFGAAVKTGIQKATGRFVLFMDADGSHTPEFIPSLLEFKNDFDVVIASRYVTGGHTENSRSLIWMSRALNWTYSFALGLKCNDVSNSFKIYRAEQLRNLDLICQHFDVVEEILFKLAKTYPGLRIKEVPFTFKKRMFGETKRSLIRFVFAFLATLIRLRLSYRPRPKSISSHKQIGGA